MRNIFTAAMLAAIVAAVGCGQSASLTDQERADVRAYAAARAAMLDTAPDDTEPEIVPTSECKHCRGKGQVKSGDGLALVDCPYCEPDGAKQDGAGTDAAPGTDPAGPTGSSGPVPAFPAFIPPEPADVEPDTESPRPCGSPFWFTDPIAIPAALPPSTAPAKPRWPPDIFRTHTRPVDAFTLLDVAEHAPDVPTRLADLQEAGEAAGWRWVMAGDEDEPEAVEPLAPIQLNEVGYDPEIDGLLSHLPRHAVFWFPDDSPGSKEFGQPIVSHLSFRGWAVLTVYRSRWPELAERLCVEGGPVLIAMQDSREAGRLVPTADVWAGDLLADAWPEKWSDLSTTARANAAAAAEAVEPVNQLDGLRRDIARYREWPGRRHKGVVGSIRSHLVNGHNWPAALADGLSTSDQDMLHDATHQGVIVPSGDGWRTSIPETVAAKPAASKPAPAARSATPYCPNCVRPQVRWGR